MCMISKGTFEFIMDLSSSNQNNIVENIFVS